MTFRTAFRLAVVAVLPYALALGAGERGVGEISWLIGDRHGYFPEERPPTTWDAATGKNILWKTALPNWSNSSPIVADGRVYLVAEPLEYAPLLLCIDAETGKELWRRELDPLGTARGEKGKRLREGYRATWRWLADLLTLKSHLADAGEDGERWSGRADQLGAKVVTRGGKRNIEIRADASQLRLLRSLKKEGLVLPNWTLDPSKKRTLPGSTWVGMAYGTPASDGRRVWTWTTYNHYACHDRDGTLLWQRRFPCTIEPDDLGAEARRHVAEIPRWRVKQYPGTGHTSTSPILVDGVLVCNAGCMMRALDAATGELRWEWPTRYGLRQGSGIPSVLRVGGEAYVISIGDAVEAEAGSSQPHPDGPGNEVFRLRDGRMMGMLPGAATRKRSLMGAVVHGDIVINRGRTVPGKKKAPVYVAHRASLTPDGEGLEFREIWRTVKLRDLWLPVIHENTIVTAAGAVDVNTGALLREWGQGIGFRSIFSNHLLLRDGIWMSSTQRGKGEFRFIDISAGRRLAANTLPLNDPELDHEARCRASSGMRQWDKFGAGMPFPYRNRLYIRSYDYLWCIGERAGREERSK